MGSGPERNGGERQPEGLPAVSQREGESPARRGGVFDRADFSAAFRVARTEAVAFSSGRVAWV